jgi:hypothetical protein
MACLIFIQIVMRWVLQARFEQRIRQVAIGRTQEEQIEVEHAVVFDCGGAVQLNFVDMVGQQEGNASFSERVRLSVDDFRSAPFDDETELGEVMMVQRDVVGNMAFHDKHGESAFSELFVSQGVLVHGVHRQ